MYIHVYIQWRSTVGAGRGLLVQGGAMAPQSFKFFYIINIKKYIIIKSNILFLL